MTLTDWSEPTIDDRVTFFLDKKSVNVTDGTSQTFSYTEKCVMGASMISVNEYSIKHWYFH